MTTGRRVPDETEPHLYEPGDYGRWADRWWGRPPECVRPGPFALYCNLEGHDVVEHEDGTITVSPSILIKAHDAEWHGYLERGVWRIC
ncbi:MAG: hypothetical protein AB7I13_00020 [Vicinamibacterales bacterium]